MIDNVQHFFQIVTKNGVIVGEHQRAQLEEYSRLLIEWNSKVNLISRKDEVNIWSNHLLHSLAILFHVSIPQRTVVADIGSGGGLPGIPISIMMPGLKMVLIESIRKKCIALEDMITRLGLTNTKIANDRAEEVVSSHGRAFDIVLARAVAPMKDLVAWSCPLVRGGTNLEIRIQEEGPSPTSLALPALVALKGGDLRQEISEARKKTKLRYVRSIPIRFVGIEETGFVDKWIVIGGL